ncbi:extended synaptotagmin-1-like, partial [Tropilaelaps mercedesae]
GPSPTYTILVHFITRIRRNFCAILGNEELSHSLTIAVSNSETFELLPRELTSAIRPAETRPELSRCSERDVSEGVGEVHAFGRISPTKCFGEVYFPDIERCEWLNKMLGQLWPFIGQYVQEMIVEVVEPSIRASLPSYLQSFKFETIDLGDLSPRVGGIKVYNENIGRNEIIMDMEIIYSGDCSFVIKIKGFKAGIRDVQLRGLLRVELRPLTKQMPLIGGVTACFLRPPVGPIGVRFVKARKDTCKCPRERNHLP